MDFSKLLGTFHYEVERKERREMIEEFYGSDYGTPMAKILDGNRWHYLTSNGIEVVVNHEETVLITAFIITMSQARRFYKTAGSHMPKAMIKRIEKNQIKIQKFYERKLEKRLDNLRIA